VGCGGGGGGDGLGGGVGCGGVDGGGGGVVTGGGALGGAGPEPVCVVGVTNLSNVTLGAGPGGVPNDVWDVSKLACAGAAFGDGA